MVRHCPTCRCNAHDWQATAQAAMSEYHELCPQCGVVKAKRLMRCERCGFERPMVENLRHAYKQKRENVMQRLKILAVLLAALCLPVWAEAFTCPTPTTCTVTLSYKEPVTSANGLALDDLQSTTIKGTVNGTALTPVSTPATAVIGGGSITKTVTVTAPACKSTATAWSASAMDLAGNVGAEVSTTLAINRTGEAGCEPGPVTNFTVN